MIFYLPTQTPQQLQEMFKYVTDINVRSTHNADNSKMYLPVGETKLKKYTDNFSYSGGIIWNTIPPDVREAN